MSEQEKAIEALRAAVSVSPDNIPLRMHLADTLAQFGQFEQAEAEYRDALRREPQHLDIKLGLAKMYRQQGKQSQAMVIVEDLCKRPTAPGPALVLYARLLLDEGRPADAVAQYKLALENDPECGDASLAEQLGVGTEDDDTEVIEGRVREGQSIGDRGAASEVEKPTCKFDEVGGMEGVKEEIRMKILYPMQHPEMYAAYGKSIGGGILMYGPPGCGKTHLARATAGELGAGFLSVGISDVLDMWIGQSERNLSHLFEEARYSKPCVLFFDEVDALGGKRSDVSGGAGRNVINQFLSEMDGIDKSNEGILILAATNAPWHLDPAFRRPGRFDRVLFVPPPDAEARASILRIQLAGKPQETIDHAQVAKKTPEFSGADLKAVVDLAVEAKLREALKDGIPKPITTRDLLDAARGQSPTTREWFSTARNHVIYSNQGGIYDDVAKYLKL
ncbi:MAG: AAA family ATPase [Planctomycetota bacterium]